MTPRKLAIAAFLMFAAHARGAEPFRDPSLSLDQRVDDLCARLTLDEKISQLTNDAPAISRLRIPRYNWWTEGIHGALGAGSSTVFPQVIGLAASWDPALLRQVSEAISDEVRAKYHEALKRHLGGPNTGLTVWAPNINIFRDPRWGRGQETYGEDPFLTSRLAVEYIHGLEAEEGGYLKLAATPKHFAVHSGPDSLRDSFDARVGEKDLRETYLPAFEATVREGHAASLMCAYSSVNGIPACVNSRLLNTILRGEWGFTGAVVSDCGAINDVYYHHHFTSSLLEAVAKSLIGGTDLSCGDEYLKLKQALARHLVSVRDVDQAFKRLLRLRFRLGMFDADELVPFSKIPYSIVDSPEHRQLARQSARESIVLLKNRERFLPLKKDLGKIAVIGPNADNLIALLGNYHGTPSAYKTPLAAIRAKVSPSTVVVYDDGKGAVANKIRGADVALLVLGLTTDDENEEHDRSAIELPAGQEKLLETVRSTGVPYVVVYMNGGPLTSLSAQAHAQSIVEAWYPGEEGGAAIADVVFGDYNPSGRLPVTVYRATSDLPAFNDYRMAQRTYRYFTKPVLYPFGFGLSFTEFKYSALKLSEKSIASGRGISLRVTVENAGDRDGDEVVALYLTAPRGPLRSLAGFARVHLARGEGKTLRFPLDRSILSTVGESGERSVVPGAYSVSVGQLNGKFEITP